MNKEYKKIKKISDKELEETTTTIRKIDREFVEREVAALDESIQEFQKRKKGFEDLLKLFK